VLGPGGERVPSGGLADGEPDLLDENEEGTGPNCGAMNFVCRPQIVGHKKEQKGIGKESRDERLSVDHGKRPAGDGSDHDPNGGDEDG